MSFKKGHVAHNKGIKKYNISEKEIKRNILWIESEYQYIRDSYLSMSCCDMAIHLKRTIGSVKRKVQLMGLTKTDSSNLFKSGEAAWNSKGGSKRETPKVREKRLLNAKSTQGIVEIITEPKVSKIPKVVIKKPVSKVDKPIQKVDKPIQKVDKPIIQKNHPVRIDSRTVIYISDPKMEDEARRKYSERHKLMNTL
jgi:hypothetical protein